MKYLINDKGIQWFKDELKNKYFSKPIQSSHPEPTMVLKDYLGWNKQAKGKWFVGIPLMSGRLSGDFKKALRKIIETYQLEVRLTPNQDLLLCNIGDHQKSTVRKALEILGIKNPGAPRALTRHALACPALPLCGLAITEAERALPKILTRIEAQLKRLQISKSILVRVTGCPNGCARPYMAELALVGSGVNQYQLWLGGSSNLQRLSKPYLQRMPLEQLESTLEPIFLSWKDVGGKIDFGDHIKRLGDQEVVKLLSQESQHP